MIFYLNCFQRNGEIFSFDKQKEETFTVWRGMFDFHFESAFRAPMHQTFIVITIIIMLAISVTISKV